MNSHTYHENDATDNLVQYRRISSNNNSSSSRHHHCIRVKYFSFCSECINTAYRVISLPSGLEIRQSFWVVLFFVPFLLLLLQNLVVDTCFAATDRSRGGYIATPLGKDIMTASPFALWQTQTDEQLIRVSSVFHLRYRAQQHLGLASFLTPWLNVRKSGTAKVTRHGGSTDTRARTKLATVPGDRCRCNQEWFRASYRAKKRRCSARKGQVHRRVYDAHNNALNMTLEPITRRATPSTSGDTVLGRGGNS